MLLSALLGDSGQLGARGFQLRAGAGDPGFQLADALRIAAASCHGPFQFDGGLIGAILGLMAFAVQFVSAFGGGVLGGFKGSDLARRFVDLSGECGNLLVEGSLLRIHRGHATGQDDAQTGAEAHRGRRRSARPWLPAA